MSNTDSAPGNLPQNQGFHANIVTYLQSTVEAERIALSRILHDELGGLMVSAAMDAAWAEQHADSVNDVRDRLRRIKSTLASAIDLKRTLIENLRPTLLDNFGLFAAFRWHVAQTCKGAGVSCTHHYPDDELRLSAAALSGLFRIMQETLTVTFTEYAVQSVSVSVDVEEDELEMQIGHRHAHGVTDTAPDLVTPLMGSLTNRIGSLGGSLLVQHPDSESTTMVSRFPMGNLLAA